MKRIRCFILSAVCVVTALCLVGCGEKMPEYVSKHSNGARTFDDAGFQVELPKDGEEIVVVETTFGKIKIRLFEESAPIGVANFKGLVKKGYYDGLKVFRIQSDFCIQTGDPENNGNGGASLWNKDFANECNSNLYNLYGSIAYANSGAGTNGSQFFINSSRGLSEIDIKQTIPSKKDYYNKYYGSVLPLYKKYGGSPYLDGGYTVFGQIFDGLGVVAKMNDKGSTENSGFGITEEIYIKKLTVEKYSEKDTPTDPMTEIIYYGED